MSSQIRIGTDFLPPRPIERELALLLRQLDHQCHCRKTTQPQWAGKSEIRNRPTPFNDYGSGEARRQVDALVEHNVRWFESFAERTRYYAKLAARAGCDAFCLDSELDMISFPNFNDYWKGIIRQTRELFSGHLTTSHTPQAEVLRQLREDTEHTHWFRQLDSLDMSLYRPLAKEPGTSVEVMVEAMQPHLEEFRETAPDPGP